MATPLKTETKYHKHFTRFRVIDLETTGGPCAEVVEIGAVDLYRGDVIMVGSDLIRPSFPIFETGMAVHHLTDEQVAACGTLDEHLPHYLDQDGSAGVDVFVAHNWSFEREWLDGQLGGRPVICTYKGAVRVFPDAPAHRLQVLRYWLKPEGLSPVIANLAHRAAPDAYVIAFILRALLEHASVDELIAWTNQPLLLPSVGFGKYRGSRWGDLPLDYLSWIIERSDLDEDVKHTAKHYRQRALEGEF